MAAAARGLLAHLDRLGAEDAAEPVRILLGAGAKPAPIFAGQVGADIAAAPLCEQGEGAGAVGQARAGGGPAAVGLLDEGLGHAGKVGADLQVFLRHDRRMAGELHDDRLRSRGGAFAAVALVGRQVDDLQHVDPVVDDSFGIGGQHRPFRARQAAADVELRFSHAEAEGGRAPLAVRHGHQAPDLLGQLAGEVEVGGIAPGPAPRVEADSLDGGAAVAVRGIDQHVGGRNVGPARNLGAHLGNVPLLQSDQVRGDERRLGRAVVEDEGLGVDIQVDADRRLTAGVALQVVPHGCGDIDGGRTDLKW